MATRNTSDSKLLKVSCLLTRRPDLSHEEFLAYWTEKHTPMLSKPVPGGPDVHRYIQLHPIADVDTELQVAPYDGVAEIWFDDLAGAVAQFTSEHYKAVVARDEENFLDRSKTSFLFAYETPIFGA